MGLGADVRVVLVDVFALLDGALVRAELRRSVAEGGGQGLVTKKWQTGAPCGPNQHQWDDLLTGTSMHIRSERQSRALMPDDRQERVCVRWRLVRGGGLYAAMRAEPARKRACQPATNNLPAA